MPKIYLTGMCGNTRKEFLEESLGSIINYFDGLVWGYNKKEKDECAEYLESIKKDGKIEYSKFYPGRYDFARNHYLFSSKFDDGDWCLNIDIDEIVSEDFCKPLRHNINHFNLQGIDAVFLHNKIFLFKWTEHLFFYGSVHESLRGFQNPIELTSLEIFQDSSKFFNNKRSERRDKYDFVNKYLYYYLAPASYHCLLGLEDKQEQFKERQILRSNFRQECQSINFPYKPHQVKEIEERVHNLPEELKPYFNKEKILNDFYRYHVLKDRNFADNHDFNDMVQI